MPTYGLGMGEAAATSSTGSHKTLVSGGAADCIIIGVHNPRLNRAYMVHAHRNSNLASIVEQIGMYVRGGSPAGTLVVHLASQVFGAANPNDSQLVQAVSQTLQAAGLVIGTTHASSSLSLTHMGVFTPGANAAAADRQASDQSNALSIVDLKLLDPFLAPLPGGGIKSKEAP